MTGSARAPDTSRLRLAAVILDIDVMVKPAGQMPFSLKVGPDFE